MRIQTMLGAIVSGTNEKLFGPALVLLRIVFGIMLALFALDLGVDHSPTVPADLFSTVAVAISNHHESVVPFILFPLLAISGMFVFGVFTKPASILLIVILAAIDFMLLPLVTVRSLIWPELVVISLTLMGIAGGLGNAFGLNGLILRNIKNPGAFVKFLFS